MGDEAKRYEELLKNIAISDMLGVLMQMNLSGKLLILIKISSYLNISRTN